MHKWIYIPIDYSITFVFKLTIIRAMTLKIKAIRCFMDGLNF